MKNIAVEIAPNAKAEIIEALHQALAEVSVVTLKAQNFHWNVTGMSFGSLHELFQKIYEDHFEAQDELAERVKALDGYADGRFSEYLKRSAITEVTGRPNTAEMIATLKSDQETMSATLRALAELTEQHGDVVTNDIAIRRADHHDKYAWMLRAHLNG
ncbi:MULTISPECIES: DNA starvation/stationary phase protection protein [Rhodomicrobium]|uniref:Dps family protein n=1 Tax=Rhodomicrobium TaxID=1068 RepID=UPI000B4AAA28|nr:MULTISPECIES: DNA starvation/stationary phase protection protein [Rhodomicrobium]